MRPLLRTWGLSGELILEEVAKLGQAIREDKEVVDALDRLAQEWRATHSEREREGQEHRLQDMLGKNAWEHLARQSRELLLAHLIVNENKTLPDRERLSGFALCLAFEGELRSALERSGIANNELGQPLERLLLRARESPDARLRQIGEKAVTPPEIYRLRNYAAHPETFRPQHFKEIEKRLFRDGLDGHGLVYNVVMYRQ